MTSDSQQISWVSEFRSMPWINGFKRQVQGRIFDQIYDKFEEIIQIEFVYNLVLLYYYEINMPPFSSEKLIKF